MADVREVHAEPSEPTRPQGNLEDTTKQRIKETTTAAGPAGAAAALGACPKKSQYTSR